VWRLFPDTHGRELEETSGELDDDAEPVPEAPEPMFL